MRILPACLLLLCPLLAPAVPSPKETDREKVERAFGKIEDPDGDCQFALVDGKLKLTMRGGKQYDYDDEGVKNCPRVLREVKGDFVLSVRAHAVLPKKAVAVKGRWAEAGAGIIIIGPKGKAWRTGMHDFLGKERNLMLIVPNSHGPCGFEINNPGDGIYARFTRRGDTLALAHSGDGKKWVEPVIFGKLGFKDPLRVGVYGFSNTEQDTTVYLDKFRLEPLKEKNGKDR